MTDDLHYDGVVIGAGAGGGTIWRRTASASCGWNAGRSCNASWTTGTRRPCSRAASTSRRSSGTTGTVTVSNPEVNYYVGGNTKFYGAALFRLRPEDFGEITHHGGVSPAWPIDYGDLEPY